ncbi:tRNA 2-thiouridine(34) synthase MnmA [Candidatus Giovannonibacteria bacterium RIFCSPHIGHO2_01_FULL_48_47]|nr:MAG: tRNA 2-thiouridine(34) synthase MnmA [Candidatus Giovannonibacteria bacterium RIFCSPHIGHO2_01_FULL_48_47]OGF67674.1 MAG: tRNA 2-thiouridine(34) synthase MnmA [Candidatus Giovannonibacteria bacterium RIFCSPHIGHO2_02_FULL_48_15]OGF89835.1 MAG: tRNA 2-thiouridine(34) synthase MnmA [Candidatus Giovannonibacteria bacterium RIFCSPLOWO2_01_FULL_48_47]OGF95296.1 MAG: tRNA 2-thiouridine(34) synthase MnmA [Candidatus Giovannonibacteria bacterium RIFOXYC1_FULL_48_8]OGF95810.1 MAG: tRNA 2-thiouridi
MSGGVDSSVAASLLKERGYDVMGAHMLCWEGCDSKDDRQDAMRVAAKLGIGFLTFDFREEYREKVFGYMVSEYAAGRTPNPDVACNKEIKFGIFLEKALEMGANYVATGHYIRKNGDKLFEAKDKNKDQSYFLWAVPREKLGYCLFPIGDYLKSEVREMAREVGLPTADKKDSQGLCFVGKVDFREFLREILPQKEGAILNSAGEILGKHDGAHFFTAGQRHGLNLGGFPEPWYVAEKNTSANTLVVARGKGDPVLYRKEIEVGDLNLFLDLPEALEVRIRYRQPKQKATLSEIKNQNAKIKFIVPQRGVAPGQSAVFYSGEEMLGGGIIGA